MRGTLPPGVIGPFFNDEFGDVYGSIFALSADGFSDEELQASTPTACASGCCKVPDVAKVEIFGAQDEKVFVEISQKRLAPARPRPEPGDRAARRAERGRVAGVLITAPTDLQVRVAGQFNSVDELRRFPIRAGRLRACKLGDIAEIRRGYDRPAAGQGAPPGQGGDRARHLDGQGRRHHRSSARRCEKTAARDPRRPAGRHRAARSSRTSRRSVSRSVNEFVGVLIEAVLIVLAVSFVALGLHTKPLRLDMAARPGGGDHDPAGAGDHLRRRCTTGASACTRSRSAR